jgi:hypothetical protein
MTFLSANQLPVRPFVHPYSVREQYWNEISEIHEIAVDIFPEGISSRGTFKCSALFG